MKKKQFLAIMLLAQTPWASAATTGYTDEATFLTQLNPGYYLEDFSNYIYGNPINGDKLTADFGVVNGYSWTVSTIPDGTFPDTYGLFSIPSALTTYAAEDLLKITFTGNPVTALGGIFASTTADSTGTVIQQMVTVNLSDGTSVSITGSDFRGFTSDSAIAYLTINGIDTPNSNWPALSHFYVGAEIAAVPVPAAAWLFGSGLLGLLSLKKRRSNIW